MDNNVSAEMIREKYYEEKITTEYKLQKKDFIYNFCINIVINPNLGE